MKKNNNNLRLLNNVLLNNNNNHIQHRRITYKSISSSFLKRSSSCYCSNIASSRSSLSFPSSFLINIPCRYISIVDPDDPHYSADETTDATEEIRRPNQLSKEQRLRLREKEKRQQLRENDPFFKEKLLTSRKLKPIRQEQQQQQVISNEIPKITENKSKQPKQDKKTEKKQHSKQDKRNDQTSSDDKQMIVNEEIRAKQILLIGLNNEKWNFTRFEAFEKARELGYDIMQVSTVKNDPNRAVCKLIKLKQYLYQQELLKKVTKVKKVSQKELRLRPVIASNDLQTKLNKTVDFLTKGHSVRLVFVGKDNKTQYIPFFADIQKRLQGIGFTDDIKSNPYTIFFPENKIKQDKTLTRIKEAGGIMNIPGLNENEKDQIMIDARRAQQRKEAQQALAGDNKPINKGSNNKRR